LYAVDLSKLIGHPDRGFTFPIRLAHNGRSVSTTALGDTGANGFIFIDTDLAVLLCESLGLRTIRLPRECPVQGFNGKAGNPITHAVLLTLLIDGRRQLTIPMLVVDLGRYDVILGRMWFEEYGVLPDCKNYRLIWPNEPTIFDDAVSLTYRPIPRKILKRGELLDEAHQQDADRRGQLMEQKDLTKAEPQSKPRLRSRPFCSTPEVTYWDGVKKMNRALNDTTLVKPSVLDISSISIGEFVKITQCEDEEAFVTTLDEINAVVNQKRMIQIYGLEIDEAQILRSKVPSEYHDFLETGV
jgi:predicted aspartyl protease